ncbi:MAG: hypothetical protein AB8F78_13705 [Saprospiraceae bacterium]
MKKLPISEIMREADARHTQQTPPAVWDRIEASLPATGPSARVRQMRTRYMTIAASFLVLAIAGWWTIVGTDTPSLENTAETLNIEGSLELDPTHQAVFTDALYGGVLINEGTGGSDRLRACVRC